MYRVWSTLFRHSETDPTLRWRGVYICNNHNERFHHKYRSPIRMQRQDLAICFSMAVRISLENARCPKVSLSCKPLYNTLYHQFAPLFELFSSPVRPKGPAVCQINQFSSVSCELSWTNSLEFAHFDTDFLHSGSSLSSTFHPGLQLITEDPPLLCTPNLPWPLQSATRNRTLACGYCQLKVELHQWQPFLDPSPRYLKKLLRSCF